MAATTLPLLKGRIALKDALSEEENMLQKLSYPEKRLDFFCDLWVKRAQMEDIISRHLSIPKSQLRISDFTEWIHGSFNACIPVYLSDVRETLPPKVIMRFPLPYRVGEDYNPGNADEKLRCEAATYVWMQRLTDIPIPRLLGFGFPDGQSFTATENESLWHKIVWHFRSGLVWLTGSVLPPYFAHRRQGLSGIGYLLLECVEQGKMLTYTWKDHKSDPVRQKNLFRGLSRLILSLGKCPLPRIGSWTMTDRGTITLTNRPLTWHLHDQENARCPTEIPRDLTYTSTRDYYLDLLACRDNLLRDQPNSILSQVDGECQLAALTSLRTAMPKLTNRHLRYGPFVFTLTDLHSSNIFVDNDWNITSFIDLEWACVRPVEMIHPPLWLSNQLLDECARDPEPYIALHKRFVDILEEEELARYSSRDFATSVRTNMENDSFWFTVALETSPTSAEACWTNRIKPLFTVFTSVTAEIEFRSQVALDWDRGALDFIADKLKDKEKYDKELEAMFNEAADTADSNTLTKKTSAEASAETTMIDISTATHATAKDTLTTTSEKHGNGREATEQSQEEAS